MSEPNLRELKVRAQALKPSIRLGKAGLTPEFLAAFDEALTRAKLLKVRFEGFKEERKAVARELAEKSSSLLVQQVGYTAVFYRESSIVPTE
jgi:RNA-binding protein